MPTWDPGPNPFPTGDVLRITGFEYLDELQLVRHARVHVDKVPRSLWQLASDFRVRMTIHPRAGDPYPLTIVAPRGMYTDLASVPQAFWWIVGPIGRHLEASIVHDYLYMAWTDFRAEPLRRDWKFADCVFDAGLKASRVCRRRLLVLVVRSPIGWAVFRRKPYSLKDRMAAWLPALAENHAR